MHKRFVLAIVATLAVSAPGLAHAAPMPAGGIRAAALAETAKTQELQPVSQLTKPQPYECRRFYWPCWHYGYYQFYGVWGPIGYSGLYRPYARDPWSWWKFP